MTSVTAPVLGHLAMTVRDPQRMAEFYSEMLGLQIVRQAVSALMGDAVLRSRRPAEEDHELVLLTNPQAEHVAFRVQTFDELTALYRRARQGGVQSPTRWTPASRAASSSATPRTRRSRSTSRRASPAGTSRHSPMLVPSASDPWRLGKCLSLF